jgi:hypothetical protein
MEDADEILFILEGYIPTCYKQNLSIGTDPTYPTVKPVTTFLIARHEAETTHTSGGPFPEAVMKGKK